MPTQNEIAGWMREAKHVILLLGNDVEIIEKFEDRAAQVERMTCDNCMWWKQEHGQGYLSGRCICPDPGDDSWGEIEDCGPKFGCSHWDNKE